MTAAYQFKPHERPVVPGSPFNPDHPVERMWAYGTIASLAGITGGLGNALVTGNIAYFQGTLGLGAEQAGWIPAAYATTFICANLILVKFRQQFGLLLFIRVMLVAYALVTLLHLFVHDFFSAILVRGISGIAAAGLSTLGILAWFQAMPPAKRLLAIMLGVSVPQLAIPLARVLAPALLEWGDWRISYMVELALALITLAAIVVLPLPPSERSKVFEGADFVTIGLLFPGVGLLCAVLALGKIDWWFAAPWLGWALIGAILLIASAGLIEHRRSNPLLMTRFLRQPVVLRIAAVAFCVRIITAEQSVAAVGMLSSLGFGIDQLRTLFIIVTIASIAGLAFAFVTFRPATPARSIQLACLLIAVAAFLDSGATNLTGPANLYLSQALVGFAALLFIGPAMLIGLSRALLCGPQFFISWVVIFLATQNLGGLVGTALFGTLQTIREKFHSNILVQQVLLDNPTAAASFSTSSNQIGSLVTDPTLRSAEGAALVGQRVARESSLLAWNDVFLTISVLALLLFFWGVAVELNMRRRGEISPIVRFRDSLAAKLASVAADQDGGPSK